MISEEEEEAPEWLLECVEETNSMKKPTVLELDDETVLFWILHEFRDAQDRKGCDLILRLCFANEALNVWFREHAEHL